MKEKINERIRKLFNGVKNFIDKHVMFFILLLTISVPLFSSLIGVVSGICIYNSYLTKYKNELDSYSESTYQHLNEIADNVIQEGGNINLLALPDDVTKFEINTQDGITIFKFYLDNNSGMEFADSAYITVKLSNNFIISKESNYSSEEVYISNIKKNMRSRSFDIGFAVYTCYLVVIGISICIIDISKKGRN